MPNKIQTFQEKVIKQKMPITNILITQRGLSSKTRYASFVFHGQEYDLSAYMNQQGAGDININISDKGVRIVSKKKRQYFQTASLTKMQQQCIQTVPVAEAEVEEQPFQTDQPAEAEQQQYFQAVSVAETEQQNHFQAVVEAEAEQQQQQQNHFQAVLVANKQQHLWTVPVAIAGVAIASFLYLRWK